VAVEQNITDSDFPPSITGLALWQRGFRDQWRYKFAFATSVVLTPDGAIPLGTSGAGFLSKWKTNANYHADLYRKFLIDSRSRYLRLADLSATESDAYERNLQLNSLKKEILQTLYAANKGQPMYFR
jgi:hypothetical protein